MKKLQIAVGIIRNENNEIFITRRAADAHMANKLEFPGGKIEMGETPEQAGGGGLQGGIRVFPQHFFLF
ncbi:8-oxo-dGTP diphosphatase MutT [Escherichia coli]|nr:8-oxo-dGTP diphosphatase MutT [Escherichia coli]